MPISPLLNTSSKLIYRPEIDSLRCFAVISVLLYHLDITLFDLKIVKGGFLGVDIFFVISGFLITSLLLREYERNQTISLAGFYERRVRRLAPVLFTVILASFIPGWIYFLPDELISFSWSAVSSILFYSNFFWEISAQEYGVESALTKPLIHTWSLAIEEQYYLFFPPFLLAIVSLRKRKHVLAWAMSALALMSFLAAIIVTKQDHSSAFFMLPTRVWEFLVGGIAAYLSIYYDRVQQMRSGIVVVVGFLMLTFAVLFISFDREHPGFMTIIPVLGTALIILGAESGQIITRFLTTKIAVQIGLISYSLYLWHYPVFTFGRILNEAPNPLDKTVWVLISFLFAIASYHLIEKTFRSRLHVSSRTLILSSLLSLLVLSSAVLLIVINNGYQSRMPPILRDLAQDVWNPRVCNSTVFHCASGKIENGRDIFLVGDSHLRMLEKQMLSFADDSGFKFNELNSVSCLFLPGLRYVEGSTGILYFECDENLQQRREDILMKAIKPVVVVGGRFPYYLSGKGFDNYEGGKEGQAEFFYQPKGDLLKNRKVINEVFSHSFKSGINKLLKNGATVVLIYPIPEVGWHVPRLLKTRLQGADFFDIEEILENDPITTSYARYVERSRLAFDLLDSIKGERIVRIYPHRLFCNTHTNGRCVTHSSTKVFYRDDDHLSETGAKMLVDEIGPIINGLVEE